MNKSSFPSRRSFPLTAEQQSGGDFIDFQKLWLMARRQMKLVAFAGLIGLIVGILFLRASPATFTSSSQILIDLNLNRVADTIAPSPLPSISQSDAQVLSSIEVIKSKQLALVVVDQLGLTREPAFINPPFSAIAKILQPVRWLVGYLKGPIEQEEVTESPSQDTGPRVLVSGASIEDERRNIAADMLRKLLIAERVGRSYGIGITYSSTDPTLSFRIVEAYTQAFLKDQQIANIDASKRATEWLRVRIDGLAGEAQQASLAAERFRADNKLSVARGELVSDQRLADLNSQLVIVEGELAKAQARSQQMDAIIGAGMDVAVQNAVLASSDMQSPRVAELRNQYMEQKQRKDDIVARWGEDHPQAVSLKRETDNTARLLFSELQQVAAQYRSEYAVVQSREATLRVQIAGQTGENVSSNQLLVQLRDLEQRAQTLNTLYATTLANYERAVQEQSLPVSNLRVISPATMPDRASGPRLIPVVGAFMILGLMAGCGIGVLREFGNQDFRTGQTVPTTLGMKFLGYLPAVKRRGRKADTNILQVSVRNPSSFFSEVLRNIRLHLDAVPVGEHGKVVGIISILPSEGKSTIAANLAGLMAKGGAKALLIDADFRRPHLSRLLAPESRVGLVEVINGTPWTDAIVRDPSSGLMILPNLSGRHNVQGAEVLASDNMSRLLQELRRTFDYVVLDLPPVGAVVDAAAVQPLTDAFVLVLRWGSTPTELARSVIDADPGLADKIIGAVLNRTNLKSLTRYGGKGSEARAYKRYKTYYSEVR